MGRQTAPEAGQHDTGTRACHSRERGNPSPDRVRHHDTGTNHARRATPTSVIPANAGPVRHHDTGAAHAPRSHSRAGIHRRHHDTGGHARRPPGPPPPSFPRRREGGFPRQHMVQNYLCRGSVAQARRNQPCPRPPGLARQSAPKRPLAFSTALLPRGTSIRRRSYAPPMMAAKSKVIVRRTARGPRRWRWDRICGLAWQSAGDDETRQGEYRPVYGTASGQPPNGQESGHRLLGAVRRVVCAER